MNEAFEKIIIGTTTNSELARLLGSPLKETDRDGYHILWYSADTPTHSDIIYLQNDKVVMTSQNSLEPKTFITQFIKDLGKPETVVGKITEGKRDTLQTTLYLWPSQGKTVMGYGELESTQALRVYEYEPTSLAKYFETVGKDFKDYKEVTTLEERVSTITASSSATPKNNNVPFGPIEIAGMVIIIVLVGFIIWKLRKKRQSTI